VTEEDIKEAISAAERASQKASEHAKAAAAAYRNLGAIAGLRDPKVAAEAYAEAAALEDLERLSKTCQSARAWGPKILPLYIPADSPDSAQK